MLHGVLTEAWERVVELGTPDAHRPEPARRARPRAGGRDAGAAAPVRWVHISELEDPTPWLSGGELMLTTGIPLDTAAKQRSFVRLLADHNLAGLGFGIGFSHRKLPKALVDEARKRDFPLFEVPYSTPFIAITEKAFARLVNEQYEVLQRGIAVQRRLERLVLEERGLEEIAATIASAVGGTVAILDGRGERLAGRGFRRQLSADAIGGDPQGGARPRRRRPPLRPRPPLGRRARAGPPGDLAGRRAAAGLGGDRPRLRRPRGLRAPDPASRRSPSSRSS